jgi:hypothetical protein
MKLCFGSWIGTVNHTDESQEANVETSNPTSDFDLRERPIEDETYEFDEGND